MYKGAEKVELIHLFVHDIVDFSSQYGSESGTGFTVGNLVGPCQVFPYYCDSSATCAFRTYGNWWKRSPSHLKDIGTKPDHYNSEDYVDLYFDTPVIPTALQIFETYNPGSVVRILACDRNLMSTCPLSERKLKWTVLWEAANDQPTHANCHHFHTLPTLTTAYSEQRDPSAPSTVPALPAPNSHLELECDHDDYDNIVLFTGNSSTPRCDGHSRIFQPNLANLPLFPTDLIRLEFDSSYCPYFAQIDAVRLSGLVTRNCVSLRQLEASPATNGSMWNSINERASSSTFFDSSLEPSNSRLKTFSLDKHNAEASSHRLCNAEYNDDIDGDDSFVCADAQIESLDKAITIYTGVSTELKSIHQRALTALYRLPPVGFNALTTQIGELIGIPPGTISRSSLFGLTHLYEDSIWRHGPLTRLPYELLLHIFSYLDLPSLCRCACVSRQFRDLVSDCWTNFTSLNLQPYWASLTDIGLISLGKQLGHVNLTARARALCKSDTSRVTSYGLLRRHFKEKLDFQFQLRHSNKSESSHPRQAVSVYRSHTDLAASRVRRWSENQPDNTSADQLWCDEHRSHSTDRNHHSLSHYSDKMSNLRKSSCAADDLGSRTVYLKRLDLSWCGNYAQFTPSTFGNFLMDACRHLVTIRLSSCKFLNDDCLFSIANNCLYLEELDLSSCSSVTPSGFRTLGRMVHLKWISLYRTQISDEGVIILARMCQYLEHVNLGSCVNIQNMDRVLNQLTRNNRNLLSLNLWRCESLTSAGIDAITQFCANLVELDIGWCRSIAPTQNVSCIVHLTNQIRQMRKLFLTGTNLLNSEQLVLVAQNLTSNLEQLDIHSCTQVNVHSVVNLLRLCPNLKLLDISFCAQIPLASLITLRHIFRQCHIISSIPDWNTELLGAVVWPAAVLPPVDEDVPDQPQLVIEEVPYEQNRVLPALPAPDYLPALGAP